MKLLFVAMALGSIACAREASPRAPQLAFAAPVDSGACMIGETKVVSTEVSIPESRTPEQTIARADGSRLVFWIDGTIEGGFDVRVAIVAPGSAPARVPFIISGDKHAAIATLDATLLDDTHADVTYYSTNAGNFERVTTSVVCTP